ncbi:putative HNH restriction endonuclease [Flavobacterium sp. PL11]|uniref:HNH endonuclease signature motif containing protein n=1 Tax=Flavobacterium sp. PL11 TaxID=3071717 RepID=UPI002E07E3C9|nr:putative HNH restriction endonuclease [Flavobacterium sp. PL11]
MTFLRDNGNTPYLEVHHKKPLAEDGDDTIENAFALCPNCHRHAHYGKISY